MTHHIDTTHAIVHSIHLAPFLVSSIRPMPPNTNYFEDSYTSSSRLRSKVRRALSAYSTYTLYSLANIYTVEKL